MDNFDLYKDIAERTNGDIYVGVVGPVRAGKSTFITKFMETLVLPNIENKHKKERTIDELPQSAAGKTIMTTQPKFVPDEAAKVKLKDNVEISVRMVDCVGYLIDGAQGHKENGKARLVKTPWENNEIPFEQAAEIGTKKVIDEHSTIGIVLTSDGTIGTELQRNAYIKAEERVVSELKAIGKPFVIVLNTIQPKAEESVKLRNALNEKYGVSVLAMDVINMNMKDINTILETVLMEFPLSTIEFQMPKWMQALEFENPIIKEIADAVMKGTDDILKMKDFENGTTLMMDSDNVEPPVISEVKLGEGKIIYNIVPKEGLFYRVLSAESGIEIADDFQLMSYLKKLVIAKNRFDKIAAALDTVTESGYGIVMPTLDEMQLDEPIMVKQGGKYGVKLRATAPSLHIMRVDIETEISPTVGTEQQSEEMVKYLLSEFDNDPKGIWNTNMFGKSLHMMVKEGLSHKLSSMPTEAQNKMRRTLGRIINEGKGGVICILL